jgi:hypothetical protein
LIGTLKSLGNKKSSGVSMKLNEAKSYASLGDRFFYD